MYHHCILLGGGVGRLCLYRGPKYRKSTGIENRTHWPAGSDSTQRAGQAAIEPIGHVTAVLARIILNKCTSTQQHVHQGSVVGSIGMASRQFEDKTAELVLCSTVGCACHNISVQTWTNSSVIAVGKAVPPPKLDVAARDFSGWCQFARKNCGSSGLMHSLMLRVMTARLCLHDMMPNGAKLLY